MKTLLNLFSNLLKLIGRGFELMASLTIALTIPVVLIIVASTLWFGFNELAAWAITVLMVMFGIAVSLPEDEGEEY